MQILRFFDIMRESMKQVPRFFIPKPDGKSPYLERLILDVKQDADGETLSKTYLHIIYASDEDRDPHDHPFNFDSQIVHGSYIDHAFTKCVKPGCSHDDEELPGYRKESQFYGPGDHNIKIAADLHKLEVVDGPVVTLVKRGRKYREWGFQTEDGWVDHATYIKAKFPNALSTEIDE